ncbi:MAG: hypothetical protein JJU06_21755 [Ectothiorhodospiraceae bacterium]|nr:hypothetical protein [Ectothiorhodospiraceae bacterium]MCH8505781.1 hypothetical protein [Ectothiorhodospiraceae bacterium]
MSDDRKPMTPSEARAYEAPIRRQMWAGLAVGATVIVLLIILVMEARYRGALTEPRSSEAMDRALQAVVTEMSPLPEPVYRVHVRTRGLRDDEPVYEVRLYGPQGDTLYQLARSAETMMLIPYGPREGSAINFDVELALSEQGEVRGRYLQDRGLDVESYQAVLNSLVRQTLMAFHAHTGFPMQMYEGVEPDRAEIRQGWESVID